MIRSEDIDLTVTKKPSHYKVPYYAIVSLLSQDLDT